jgi:hypothetical protein
MQDVIKQISSIKISLDQTSTVVFDINYFFQKNLDLAMHAF